MGRQTLRREGLGGYSFRDGEAACRGDTWGLLRDWYLAWRRRRLIFFRFGTLCIGCGILLVFRISRTNLWQTCLMFKWAGPSSSSPVVFLEVAGGDLVFIHFQPLQPSPPPVPDCRDRQGRNGFCQGSTSKLKSATQVSRLALLLFGWQQAWRWVASAKVALLQSSALGDLHFQECGSDENH